VLAGDLSLETGWWPAIPVANAMLTLWLGLALLLGRAGADDSQPTAADPPERRAARLLIPGISDLLQGKPWRGYTGLTTFILVGVAVVTHLTASRGGIPCAGPLTATLLDVLKAFHVPPLPYWPLFWTYADAPFFWGVVSLAAAVALVLHLTSPRRREHSSSAPDDAAPPTSTTVETRSG
jgi:hypothetical protein